MKPQLIIAHGASTLALPGERLSQSTDSADAIEKSFQSTNPDYLKVGDDIPGYPGLKVKTRERIKAGLSYTFRVTASGRVDEWTEDRREDGYPKYGEPIADFDTIEDSWITDNPDRFPFEIRFSFVEGIREQNYHYMFCVDRKLEYLGGGLYRLRLSYQGIMGIEKAYKRNISCKYTIVNRDDGTKYKIPQITVRDSFAQRGLPDFSDIGKVKVPDDAPAIPTLSYFPNRIKQEPFGWILDDIEGDFLKGTDVYAGVKVYTYYHEYLP